MLARDTSVFGFSRTQRRGLSGQACTVAAFVQGQFQLHQLTSPQGAHREERGVSKVEQPQPFCLIFLKERWKSNKTEGVGGLSCQAVFTGVMQSWRDKHEDCGPAQPAARSLL